MSRFQIDRGRAIMVQRTFPPRDADAPFVTRLKSRKAPFGTRRDQIIPVEHREIEKFPGHLHADRMQAHIFRARAAKAVAIKAGHWIAATAFQFGSENISGHAAILALEIKFARFWSRGKRARKRRTFLSMKKTVIAYWLIPTEPARSFFAAMIGDLARRCDAPVFEPHLTAHVGLDLVEAEEVITRVARSCRPVQAEVLRVRQSPEFIKTLFVEFAVNSRLQQLNEMIRKAAQDSSDYQLKPHLSLLYNTMSIQARRQLVQSIKIPFLEVIFDSIKAIRCVAPTRSRADVEGWRVVAAKRIGV
jgi:hypothetical protein